MKEPRVPAIELQSVSKRFGSKTVVHELTFSVAKGEIVGILGPNGAGKTTTMRMVAGSTTASSGCIRVAGFDMARDNESASRKLGYLPENPPLYDTLKLAQYLRFVAKSKGMPRREIDSEIDRVAAACCLQGMLKQEIYKLSKGYRQRVGLAQALLGKPEVLLLDEPTAGLDPAQIQDTREVIRSFGEHHAVLLSTHFLAEATLLCHRVAIIDQGRLLAIDSTSSLQGASEQTNCVVLTASAPADALRIELLSIPDVLSVVTRDVPGVSGLVEAECQINAREDVQAAIARAVAVRWNLHRLERRQPTLENIFLRYVRGKSSTEVLQ